MKTAEPRKRRRAQKIAARDLRGWKMLARFDELLERARARVEPGRRELHGLRRLGASEYLRLFLLGVFNPIVSSMRALCAASEFRRVQEQSGGQPVALSRFSEAQHVFDPELLRHVMEELVERGAVHLAASRGGRGLEAGALRIIDSTVWTVVPRMAWASYGAGRSGNAQGVRLHLRLRVGDAAPVGATLSCASRCERAELRANLQPGELLLGDRNFAEDYQLLDELVAKGCGFLFRLRKSARLQWQSQEALGPAEVAGAITRAGRARLGTRARSGPWRVVVIEPAGREPVVLVSSAHFDGLSAAELAELYRRRWQVELFFRWLKCVLPCRHWFAESERGVSFQVYLSLICALLLAEALGRRPGKRLMEALAFRHMGWASEDELQSAIEREWRASQQRAARKKTA
jgi:hypothetical protein